MMDLNIKKINSQYYNIFEEVIVTPENIGEDFYNYITQEQEELK